MKRNLNSFVILIAVFFLVSTYHPFPGQAATAKEPVKIGVITPLSPPGDPAAGQLIVRGAKFGAKYVNEEMKGILGGRPIELMDALHHRRRVLPPLENWQPKTR